MGAPWTRDIAARDASLYLEKIAGLKVLPLFELVTKAWAALEDRLNKSDGPAFCGA
jgi:hypothetical protein